MTTRFLNDLVFLKNILLRHFGSKIDGELSYHLINGFIAENSSRMSSRKAFSTTLHTYVDFRVIKYSIHIVVLS